MTLADLQTRPSAPAVHRPLGPLRVLGTSVTQIPAVQAAARDDLGLPLEFITLDGAAAQRRGALHPKSFEIYDQWFHDLDLVWPTGSLQPIDTARIAEWETINALPKTGRLEPSTPRAGGGDPSRRLYVQIDGSLGAAPSSRISMVPTVHNADGFAAINADAVTSWAALLDPAMAGRVVLQSDPAIGALELLLALHASGTMHPEDMGDLTLGEIDGLIAHVSRAVAAGQFRTIWTDEDEAIAALQDGTPMIGSLWWSGVVRLRAKGVPVRMVVPDEGYRGWFGGLALSAHLKGRERDAAYDYLNWWLTGRAGAILARQGAYMTNACAVRAALSADEWDFWYGGAPAKTPIRDTEGRQIFASGEIREGGSYAERMRRVVVWDTVMTEHNYLLRKWAHALAQ